MKKYLLFTLLLVFVQAVSGQAKYVFYFIGDGMGVNHVNAAEAYLSALNGKRGTGALLMTSFPVASFATTFSADGDVTDSAAAGTALATGSKTNNGVLGLCEHGHRLETVAEKAKKAGRKVGIASTVPVNHATPAAFYAHQKDRDMYYEIAQDMIASNFDFFAGSGLYNRAKLFDKTPAPDVFPQIEKAGYVLLKGYDDYLARAAGANKVLLLPRDWEKEDAIPFAIDRKSGDLTLKEITQAAVGVLSKDSKKGFFLMLEGGRIDWSAHGNDAATTIREVIDMDEAIGVALDFYRKHPKETLILVTADHETGGLGVGKGGLNLKLLQHQRQSQEGLTARLNELQKAKNGKPSWEDVKALLTETMGFWTNIPISWKHEKALRDAYEETLARQREIKDKSLYAENALLATKARDVMNDLAQLGWASGAHSAGYAPVFAIGAGQELFKRKMDNTEIPKLIIQAAGY